jgi:hypothetical protein
MRWKREGWMEGIKEKEKRRHCPLFLVPCASRRNLAPCLDGRGWRHFRGLRACLPVCDICYLTLITVIEDIWRFIYNWDKEMLWER